MTKEIHKWNLRRITRLLVQQSDLAQLSLFCSILLLLHFIRTHFTYFKGDNIGAKCVQMKTEALIILKKVQSLLRGQDLQDVGNSAQDAFTSWTVVNANAETSRFHSFKGL